MVENMEGKGRKILGRLSKTQKIIGFGMGLYFLVFLIFPLFFQFPYDLRIRPLGDDIRIQLGIPNHGYSPTIYIQMWEALIYSCYFVIIGFLFLITRIFSSHLPENLIRALLKFLLQVGLGLILWFFMQNMILHVIETFSYITDPRINFNPVYEKITNVLVCLIVIGYGLGISFLFMKLINTIKITGDLVDFPEKSISTNLPRRIGVTVGRFLLSGFIELVVLILVFFIFLMFNWSLMETTLFNIESNIIFIGW
jgi:hypothetical protein